MEVFVSPIILLMEHLLSFLEVHYTQTAPLAEPTQFQAEMTKAHGRQPPPSRVLSYAKADISAYARKPTRGISGKLSESYRTGRW